MSVSIRFLGTAAFEIVTEQGRRILIDPYLDESLVSPLKVTNLEQPDILLVTHGAHDHLGDAEAILRRFPDLPLICSSDVRGYLLTRGLESGRLQSLPWGMMTEEKGVRIRSVQSCHWSYIQTEEGRSFSAPALGFIIYTGDERIYHSGDTTLFSDLKLIGELYKPTVGLINVGVPRDHRGATHGVETYLSGEMDAHEAALACQWLGLEIAIPCHHDDPTLPEIVRFEQLLTETCKSHPGTPRPVILAPGDTFTTPPRSRK
jgi:L-ascorbate metabolism protein UlaG (beta-lactamase superfamily)